MRFKPRKFPFVVWNFIRFFPHRLYFILFTFGIDNWHSKWNFYVFFLHPMSCNFQFNAQQSAFTILVVIFRWHEPMKFTPCHCLLMLIVWNYDPIHFIFVPFLWSDSMTIEYRYWEGIIPSKKGFGLSHVHAKSFNKNPALFQHIEDFSLFLMWWLIFIPFNMPTKQKLYIDFPPKKIFFFII